MYWILEARDRRLEKSKELVLVLESRSENKIAQYWMKRKRNTSF